MRLSSHAFQMTEMCELFGGRRLQVCFFMARGVAQLQQYLSTTKSYITYCSAGALIICNGSQLSRDVCVGGALTFINCANFAQSSCTAVFTYGPLHVAMRSYQ